MSSSSQVAPPVAPDSGRGLATFLYRWRWLLSAVLVAITAFAFGGGVKRVADFSAGVASLADTSNGNGAVKPLFFDPSMGVWFGEEDAAVRTYYDVENTFVAEDFVVVGFEVPDHEFGVFSRESLAAIARLTEDFLTIPGVRHVRSLTYNPWIRWGEIEGESGLIITDLVEGDPLALTDEEIIERMVATLGAERVAERLGEDRVRAVLGAEADFDDHIGEPLLLGTILDETGSTTTLQVQVLRPRVETTSVDETFHDETARRVGPTLSSIERQRAAVRGVMHFLRQERGLSLPTPERAELVAWIESLPDGQEKAALELDLADPNKNFMRNGEGELVRKFYEYDPDGEGGWVDRTEPSDPIQAPADFQPAGASAYSYHLGGVPLFELNFETVGIADGKFVPLMFLVIIAVLFALFRNIAGIGVPLAVVFGSIMAMIGVAFSRGDLLNNLTMMSPNMLTAVGIADAIHLVASWVLLRSRYDDKRELIIEVVRKNALPVFLTSVTTAVGFYSLTVSKLTPVQQLGSMAAFGTFAAWAFSMTVIPALLSLVPHHGRSEAKKPSRLAAYFNEDRAERFVSRIVGKRPLILAAGAILFGVSLFGVSRVEIDSDFRAMFPDDNPVMSDFQWIEDRLGGVGDLEIVFRGVGGDTAPELTREEEARWNELELRSLGAARGEAEFQALDDTEAEELTLLQGKRQAWNAARIGVSTSFLTDLDAFEARLRSEMAEPDSELHVITDLISPLDTLRKIHQVQHENSARFYRVPSEADVPDELREPSLEYDEWAEEWSLTPAQDGSTLAAQYYLQYESGARPGEALWTQLSADRTQFRMQARVAQASSITHLKAFQRIEEIGRSEFPQLVAQVEPGGHSPRAGSNGDSSMTLSGKSLLFARTSDLFTRGFLESMTIALIVITILIGIIFRSIGLAVISLIPNLLPIMMPLSAFGLLGVPLDGPAILVSSVALGVCVDDTIHFFTKFVRARRAGRDPQAALQYVFTEAGAAMSATTVVLMIGFSTLLLSDFAPNFQMGALAAVMIGLAWIADFVVTTAVLSCDGLRCGVASTEPAPASNAPAMA